jgi:hypothetical protein
MATRRGVRLETVKEASERIYKNITRSYVLWTIGLVIGAVGLRPASVNAAGLSMTFEKPEIVQGIVYLACLLNTSNVLLNFQNKTNPYHRPDALRNFIWSALPRGTRSFRGKTHSEFLKVRSAARLSIKGVTGIAAAFAVIPAFFIVVFNPLIVLRAIGSIIGLI